MTVNDTIRRIRAFARFKGWNRNRLATEAKVAESTIRQIFDDGWNPRADTLRQLEAVIPAEFVPDDHAQYPEAAE